MFQSPNRRHYIESLISFLFVVSTECLHPSAARAFPQYARLLTSNRQGFLVKNGWTVNLIPSLSKPYFHVFGIAKTWYIGRVEEESYRQSRLCRLLGNPVAFAVVQLLAENRELTPSETAGAVGRSVQRVSNVLAALR